jgi:hypothetical protein
VTFNSAVIFLAGPSPDAVDAFFDAMGNGVPQCLVFIFGGAPPRNGILVESTLFDEIEEGHACLLS